MNARFREILERARRRPLSVESRPYVDGLSSRYHRYQTSAVKRSLEFALSYASFCDLQRSPCYYCAREPAQGVDRFNNALGYTDANAVPCCKSCNYMKHTQSADAFVEQCRRVVRVYGDAAVST